MLCLAFLLRFVRLRGSLQALLCLWQGFGGRLHWGLGAWPSYLFWPWSVAFWVPKCLSFELLVSLQCLRPKKSKECMLLTFSGSVRGSFRAPCSHFGFGIQLPVGCGSSERPLVFPVFNSDTLPKTMDRRQLKARNRFNTTPSN